MNGKRKNEVDLEGGSTNIILTVGTIPSSNCCRIGGTWAKKYQTNGNTELKQDIRNWDIAPSKEYFENYSGLVKIRLYGAVIILICHQQDALLRGIKRIFQKIFLWQCVSMLGVHLIVMQKYLDIFHKEILMKIVYTQRRSPLHYMNGFLIGMQSLMTLYLILM